jgi:hypothetical protein
VASERRPLRLLCTDAWRPGAPQGRGARGRRVGSWGEAAAARGGKGALELLSAYLTTTDMGQKAHQG